MMSLFVNKEVEPKVHLSSSHISESNQEVYRLQFLAEVLKCQDTINKKLAYSLESINSLFQKTALDQQQQNLIIESKIEGQKTVHSHMLINLERLEAIINERMEQINGDKQEIAQLVGKEEIVHQTILAQLSTQDQISMNIIKKISELEIELTEHIKNQQSAQTEITSKLEVQDVYHKTVMERLDQQEAITHKVNRQLDNLKSVIFERIGHLAEKIEVQSKHTIKSLTGLFFKPELKSNGESKDNESEKITIK